MRGWLVHRWGEARFEERIPEPLPDPDAPRRTLIDVHAAAANFADRLMIDGRYQLRPQRPFVPGFEVAGTVVESNDGAFQPGDRVVGVTIPQHGSWAERCVADSRHLMPIPDDVGWAEAIGVAVNAQTAWFALHRSARVSTDDVVLVHAAAGGVGSCAVQLAAHHGCTVVGTSSAGKLDRVRSLGATFAADNRDDGWPALVREATGGVDVVIDPVGGSVLDRSLRLLNFEGRYVVVGFASGEIAALATNQALIRNISLHGMYWTPYADRRPDLVTRATDEIWAAHAAGALLAGVTVVAPLEQAIDCAADVTAGRTTGKTVLMVR